MSGGQEHSKFIVKLTNIIQGRQNSKMAPNESNSCLTLCPVTTVACCHSVDCIMVYSKSENFVDVIKN